MKENNFVDLKLSVKNLDRFYIRLSIFKALTNNLILFKGKLLDVGCGKMPYRDYIKNNSKITSYHGLDIDTAIEYDKAIKADFLWDGIKMPFKDNSYDTIILTEVLEHCPDINLILNEIYRVLKNNGIVFFTVPFLWPLHEVPHDEHRYTPFALERYFKASNFTDIKIASTGGWHASMAQMLGLWIKRGVSNKNLKLTLSYIFKPVIAFLIKKDKIPMQYNEGQMNTGFCGTAYKLDE